jgi:hypothetical protein
MAVSVLYLDCTGIPSTLALAAILDLIRRHCKPATPLLAVTPESRAKDLVVGHKHVSTAPEARQIRRSMGQLSTSACSSNYTGAHHWAGQFHPCLSG